MKVQFRKKVFLFHQYFESRQALIFFARFIPIESNLTDRKIKIVKNSKFNFLIIFIRAKMSEEVPGYKENCIFCKIAQKIQRE